MILWYISEYNQRCQSEHICLQLNILQTLFIGLVILNSIQNNQKLEQSKNDRHFLEV